MDTQGRVLEGAGAFGEPIFARSSIKSLQALPLFETGAAERCALDDAEVALALSSHSGETIHTERVAALLARLGLEPRHLQCGPQVPWDVETRNALRGAGIEPTTLHNNCSGKHAGFLALAAHLGEDREEYLNPSSRTQRLVREAIASIADLAEPELTVAVDGCSAPTFRLPLVKIATAIARVANPDGLAPERRAACVRMTNAVAAHPDLVAGTRNRLCTDLARVSGGRLFPKLGGEAVYVVGIRGADRGLAVKIDDGNPRGFNAFVIEALQRFGHLSVEEADQLTRWSERRLRNWAGLEVGRLEVLV